MAPRHRVSWGVPVIIQDESHCDYYKFITTGLCVHLTHERKENKKPNTSPERKAYCVVRGGLRGSWPGPAMMGSKGEMH